MVDAMNILSSVGCATLSTFPYDAGVCHDLPTSAQLAEAGMYRIDSWERVNLVDLTEVKEFLHAGQPVVIGFRVYTIFFSLYDDGPNAVYDQISGDNEGGHAVVLVGYNDDTERFKAMNSWGSTWGDAGYFYLSYSLWATVVREGYVAVDGVAPCTGDIECDDGLYCNGEETCNNGVCEPGQAPCPGGVSCNEASDQCGGDSDVEWIYFMDTGAESIRRVRPDGSGLSTLVAGQESPLGISVDDAAGKLYWTDLNADVVRRANLDGSSVETLVSDTSLFNSPWGLTLDPSTSRMYWLANNTSVTPNQQAIFRASLSGSAPQVILGDLGGSPIGIAFDDVNDRLFWTNQGTLGGTDGSLWRIDLNGLTDAPVVPTGITLRDPRGIVVDAAGGRIYWTDILAGAGVYSARTDGTDAQLLCADAGTLNGVALDLSARRIYWTNQSDETIKVGAMDGPCNPSIVVGGLVNPFAIALSTNAQ
jgi:sugar lactone lactonase YvrE